MTKKMICKAMTVTLAITCAPLHGNNRLKAFTSTVSTYKFPCAVLLAGGSLAYGLYQKRQCSKLEKDNAAKDQELRKASADFTQINQKLSKKDKLIVDYREENKSCIEEKKQLNNQLLQAKQEHRKESEQLQKTKAELEKEIERITLANKNLSHFFNQKKQELDSALVQKRKECGDLQRQLSECNKKIRHFEEQAKQREAQKTENNTKLKNELIQTLVDITGYKLSGPQREKITKAKSFGGLLQQVKHVRGSLPTQKTLVDENSQLKNLMQQVMAAYDGLSQEEKAQLLNFKSKKTISDLLSRIKRVVESAHDSQEGQKETSST